jgi:type III restriction enzyme
LWSRYAFKLATGAGKTKIMSLAIVWSYFHALRESDSELARHFVVIAPNLTVYERLKEDFGGGKIFDADPLIPVQWRGDWNLSVVLQDEAGGAGELKQAEPEIFALLREIWGPLPQAGDCRPASQP